MVRIKGASGPFFVGNTVVSVGRFRLKKTVTTACLWLCVSHLAGFNAQVTASDFGTTGLIDIPTARMRSDGTLAFTAGYDERHRQFAVTYQATPWLEATYRYTGFNEFFRWDRNYEVKLRLLEEDDFYLPSIAVGIRDLVGTGLFGSEYVVASKRFGQLDATVGIGWGRLAGDGDFPNPVRLLNERFDGRNAETGRGGELSIGDFFSGPDVGIFGGVSYDLPSLPITLTAEYNPDQYEWDLSRGGKAPSSPVSIGINWQISDNVEIALTAQHGDELGLRFTSAFDSVSEHPKQQSASFISSYYLPQNKFPAGFRKTRWFDRLVWDAERSGLLVLEGSLSADSEQVELVVGNLNYQLWSDALSQHIAMADLHLPASVKTIYFIVEESGHRVATMIVPRPSYYGRMNDDQFLLRSRMVSGRSLKDPQHQTSFVTGKINTTINLRTRFQFFDPDDPARYQVFVGVDSEYALSNYWSVKSSIALNLDQNFDESNRRESNSVLSPVRTEIVKYLDDGATRLESLVLEGRDTLGSTLHYRVFGGVLEQMYMGAGGEVLYWPSQSRIALGASIAYAKQRDYDGRLGVLDYDTVTGFVSAYYASEFYNYDFAVHAGQYLAKDMGATFEVRRTFRNGWQVGLWASLTDVPFEDFGEGSFDKGMYFQIPLSSLFNSSPSRSNFGLGLRPIQRDGGQRLDGYSGQIFWDVRAARYDSFKLEPRLAP